MDVVVKWLIFLLHTGEVPGSNLSRRPAILTEVFRTNWLSLTKLRMVMPER
jgi:hypothetical protein